jgi:hypothetical protein
MGWLIAGDVLFLQAKEFSQEEINNIEIAFAIFMYRYVTAKKWFGDIHVFDSMPKETAEWYSLLVKRAFDLYYAGKVPGGRSVGALVFLGSALLGLYQRAGKPELSEQIKMLVQPFVPEYNRLLAEARVRQSQC